MAGGTARRRSLATLACRNFTSCGKAQRSITCLAKRSPSALASFRMLLRKNKPPAMTAMTIIRKTRTCPRCPDRGGRFLLLVCLSDEELVIFRDDWSVLSSPRSVGAFRLQHHGEQSAETDYEKPL